MDCITALFIGTDKLTLVLAFGIIILLYLLYKAQVKKDSFDLRYLIVDETTKKVSLSKFAQFIALILSSWAFVHLTLHDKLTEYFMTIFMTCWGGLNAVHKAIDTFGNKSVDIVTDKTDNTGDDKK